MRISREIFGYFSRVGLKLLLLGFVTIFLILIVPFLLDSYLYKSSAYVPLILGALPFLAFLVFLAKNLLKSRFIHILASCKYNPWFPYHFRFQTTPRKSGRIDLEKILNSAECGDIILRRYDWYLDGIIFSENSYFTHVGICYRDDKDKPCHVLHATAQHGVHMSPLKDFCQCDDIALLRFSLDPTEEEKTIGNYILNEKRVFNSHVNLKKAEHEVFEKLLNKTKLLNEKSDDGKNSLTLNSYLSIVVNRAVSLIGTPYDLRFNFKNFEAFSCIEYVWYCYKCLFPWHRIRVKDFEFFNWINMPVIIPDVFIKNDFFSCVYCSLPGIETKAELKRFVKKGNYQFLLFLISLIAWNIILLFCYHQIPESVRSWVSLSLLQSK